MTQVQQAQPRSLAQPFDKFLGFPYLLANSINNLILCLFVSRSILILVEGLYPQSAKAL